MTAEAGATRGLAESFLGRYRLAALIQAIEDDLRRFIREYIAPYTEPETLFGERVGELMRRAAAEGVVDPSSSGLVEFIDFGDAFAILNRHRGMLPESLASGVRTLTPAFETAVPIRNRVMHGRPPRVDDDDHIERLAQSLVTADTAFPLTESVVSRLLDDPLWTPAIDIASAAYGNALHNLPLPEFDETGLLGRDEEVREVGKLLADTRFPVVTIAGEGGIGKTALAVQTLYDLVDAPECPYDAVLWASLKTERLTGRGIQEIRDAAVDVMSLAGELSSAIGESANTDIRILAEVLRDTPTLIAIDNVESIGTAEIRELITALPECKFLLTSRVGLGELEWRVTLRALGPAAAKIMLRQLASRRGLHQLARMSDRQANVVVDQLRRSPLAIRWFVEAVHAGGQPDDLLRDQSAVLQFSMSTIYDSLAEEGRQLVDALLALDAAAGIGELALLTGLHRDEVVEQIYELQRRAVVHVDRSLSETLSQSYALSDMARQYLERFGTLDSGFAEQIRKRLREIAASDELTKRFEGRAIHIPEAIAAETSEERAVAEVLRQALRRSKGGDLGAARDLIVRARDAVPGYFESYRVSAFIESDIRPEEARRQYAEAYRLAPEHHRPKVAYWLAGHLMRNLMAPAEAERYAREAHEALALPETALRLGRVLMYQHRFDEAEPFLEAGAQAEYGRTRAIAETDLLDLAKRRTERLTEVERQPGTALTVALAGLERGWRFAASGVPDRRFFDALAELVAESLLVALRAPDLGGLEEPLTELLEGIDRHFVVLSRPGLRELWQSRVERLCGRGDCPADLVLYGEKLATRLDRQLERSKQGLESGIVLEYSAKKGYGFIRPVDGGDNIFFHRTGVTDPQDRFLLVRGAEVTFVPREAPHNGEMRMRAEQVSVARPELERERDFRRRRGVVVHITETFLFAEDIPTQERIFVHRSSFRNPEEWKSARAGSVVALDLEFNAQGAKAVSGSVLTDPGDR